VGVCVRAYILALSRCLLPVLPMLLVGADVDSCQAAKMTKRLNCSVGAISRRLWVGVDGWVCVCVEARLYY
jgi:hypothetical protein